MTNPELGSNHREIDRREAEQRVYELSQAVEEVRHRAKDTAWNSILSNAENEFPEEVSRLKHAVEAALGLPVEGRTTATQYYVSRNEGFVSGKLGLHHGVLGHYYEGTVQFVGGIPTPPSGQMRLCLGIGSLSFLLGDFFDDELDSYYKRTGRADQLRQPFCHQDFQDQIIFLPVDSADERGIRLLDRWKA